MAPVGSAPGEAEREPLRVSRQLRQEALAVQTETASERPVTMGPLPPGGLVAAPALAGGAASSGKASQFTR